MRPLHDEHHGTKVCDDADPCPTLRTGVRDIYLAAPLDAQARAKSALGYHRVFNLILWVLYTGMQWKCTVYKVRLRRTTSLRAGLLLAVGSFDRLAQRAWLLAASRPAWERLRAAGRGLLSATQPQAGPARQPSCGRRAAGRAHGQPPGAG